MATPPAPAPEAEEVTPRRSPLRSEIIVICTVGLLAAVTLILWTMELESRGAILVSEIARLSPLAAQETGELVKVRMVRGRYEEFLQQTAAVVTEEEVSGCAPALRVLATNGVDAITLRTAAVKPGAVPHTWYLQVQGTATGSAPRLIADHYLQSLQNELSRRYTMIEPCRFLHLDEEAASAFRGVPHRATFSIQATLMERDPGGTVEQR